MDQAATLRKMTDIREVNAGTFNNIRVIAITSGKGGVGKTNVVANLAIALSKLGKKVMILDADLGLGNLDVLLGLTPKYNVQHLLMGEKGLSDIIVNGPSGIMILPSSSGVQELTSLTDEQQLNLLTEFDKLPSKIDFFLIDTGAGISSNVIYFSTAAQEIIVIVSPEPTSITDAYALMKVLSTKHAERKFKLLVNMIKDEREAKEVYRKLSIVADRFLNISIDYIGYITLDNNMPKAVCRQKAIVDIYPNSQSSRAFDQLARTICEWPAPLQPKSNIQFLWKRLIGAGS
ncbi:MAG: MinD/ParA family protein [Nitrospirota bacterium]